MNPCAFGQPTPKIAKKGRLMNITNLSWIGLMNLSAPEDSTSQWPTCSWDVHPFPLPAVQAENLATRVGHVAGASQDTKKAVVFGWKSTMKIMENPTEWLTHWMGSG